MLFLRAGQYAECVNMLEGLADEEVDQYLQVNPKIVPLFEINVVEVVSPKGVTARQSRLDP